jgi:hypothetical protein
MDGPIEEQVNFAFPDHFEINYKDVYEFLSLYTKNNPTNLTEMSNNSPILSSLEKKSELIENEDNEPNDNEIEEKRGNLYNQSNYTSLTEIPNIHLILSFPENETEKATKETNKENDSLLSKKRKRKIHDKFDKDNIKRKVQVNYLKFLVEFVNKIILKIFDKFNKNNILDIKSKKKIENYQFKSLNYDFSKKIDSFSFNKYKSKKISEILKENTSPKYKKYNNVDVYDNIIHINKKLNNILNKPYLEFFEAFYQKQNFFNLKKYGFDLDIYLDDIKRFQEFTEEQKEKTNENFELYLKRIEECINSDFISNKFFFLIKK